MLSRANAERPPGLNRHAVWTSGEDGYHTYRIPSLVVTDDGALLAFCEGRKSSQRDQGDIDLLIKSSNDEGATWSDQRSIWDDGEHTCGNPCPVVDRDTGVIWMLMTWNRSDDSGRQLHLGKGKDTRRVYVTSSADDGRQWTEAKEITSAVKKPGWHWYATGPGVGVQVRHGDHRGRLVIPCDHTADGHEWGSHVVVSDDHGATWRVGGVIQSGTNECQVAELDDGSGTLLMNLRSADAKDDCRLKSVSESSGDVWSAAQRAIALPDPQCQGSIIRYSWREDEGVSRILFSNPADPDDRKRLTVRLSLNEGRTWCASKVIFDAPSAYSCLARMPTGRIGLLFEGGTTHPREAIYFASLPIEDLEGESQFK